MNVKSVDYEIGDLSISRLGEATINSNYKTEKSLFVDDKTKVLFHTNTKDISDFPEEPKFELAGPHEKLFFEPKKVVAGIVTCGGLCPGLNDVIRAITLTLLWQYGVRKVLGFRYGYEGMSSNAKKAPIELSETTFRKANTPTRA